MRLSILIPLLPLVLPCWPNASGVHAQTVGYFTNTTYKIVQLTGETDSARRIPTTSRTYENECVTGTDLGSTFEHNGLLYFLFGDTPSLPCGTGTDDFLGWSDARRPEDIFLNVHKSVDCRGGSCFEPITIPGVRMAGCEVPSYGISVSGRIYMVATTDALGNCDMGRSVMTVSEDDGRSFRRLYDLSTLDLDSSGASHIDGAGKIINVSMVEVHGQRSQNLPEEPCVLIWGSGKYRGSNVRLAYVPSSQIANRSAIRYLSGVDRRGSPLWSKEESNAIDLFDQPQIGELSVQFCGQLGQWIMLYNSDDFGSFHAGIHMRSARWPWGPWSPEPTVVFDGWRDRAYGRYIHVSTDIGQWDVFSDSPYVGPETSGGPYGPYLIPRFFHGDHDRATIVYTMSTWNPYQAILMQSDIGYPDQLPPERNSTFVTLPGSRGWKVSGNFLRPFVWTNGVPYVTSYADHGDADMGVAQYGFLPSSRDQALEFGVHGGDAEVVLIEQTNDTPTSPPDIPQFYAALKRGDYGRVVETVIGPQSNDHELTVRWDLRRHCGKRMRLFVIDWLDRPWGFISVSQITRFSLNAASHSH